MSYLMHHGIKGQKWGVRKGPPYPIETGMKKGTKLNNVTALRIRDTNKFNEYVKREGSEENAAKKILSMTPTESVKKAGAYIPDHKGRSFASKDILYTYNKQNQDDKEIYEGPFADYTIDRSFNSDPFMKSMIPISVQMEVVKDLEMPTKKERIDEFIKLLDKKSVKDLEAVRKRRFYYGATLVNGSGNVDLKKVMNGKGTDEEKIAAYTLFNYAMEFTDGDITKKYLKNMTSKYDAMVDDNNQKVYNNANDPVIIFNANKNVRITDIEKLNVPEIADNIEKVRKKNDGRVVY